MYKLLVVKLFLRHIGCSCVVDDKCDRRWQSNVDDDSEGAFCFL